MAADSQNSPIPEGDSDTLALYLTRKERELNQQIAALRSALAPKERELQEVHKAMHAIGLHAGPLKAFVPQLGSQRSFDEMVGGQNDSISALAQTNSVFDEVSPLSLVTSAAARALHGLTIKQMILSALKDHFHNGASPTELRDYMRTVYGREIDRNSISPQLARMREEGTVEQPPGLLNEGKWIITRAGKWYGVPLPLREE
jgi:hypothetical protein